MSEIPPSPPLSPSEDGYVSGSSCPSIAGTADDLIDTDDEGFESGPDDDDADALANAANTSPQSAVTTTTTTNPTGTIMTTISSAGARVTVVTSTSTAAEGTTTTTTTAKRQQQKITYNRKLLLIERLRRLKVAQGKKLNIGRRCAKWGVTHSLLNRWAREEELIRTIVRRGEGNAIRVRETPLYGACWESTYSLDLEKEEQGSPVTIDYIRQHMESISVDFRALHKNSQYRLIARWKRRYGLSQRRATGVSQLLPHDYLERIRHSNCILANSFSTKRPSRVIVLDETSVVWNCTPMQVLKKRGCSNVCITIKGNEKTSSTALLWSSVRVSYDEKGEPIYTDESHGPPVVIFKGTVSETGKYRSNAVMTQLRDLPPRGDVLAAISPNGWIDSSLMLDWAKKIPMMTHGERGWLIMDLFSAHRDEAVISSLQRRGYHVFFVPPGCTSKVQFHDVHINADFKRKLRSKWTDANIENPDWQPDRQYVRDTVADIMSSMAGPAALQRIRHGIHELVIQPAREHVQFLEANPGLLSEAKDAVERFGKRVAPLKKKRGPAQKPAQRSVQPTRIRRPLVAPKDETKAKSARKSARSLVKLNKSNSHRSNVH